jgi:hypothetical protein
MWMGIRLKMGIFGAEEKVTCLNQKQASKQGRLEHWL